MLKMMVQKTNSLIINRWREGNTCVRPNTYSLQEREAVSIRPTDFSSS